MKKLSLLLLLSVFVFGFVGCSSEDDKATVYQLDLPTLDANTEYVGDTENPVDSWEESGDGWSVTYIQTLLKDKSNIFGFDCVSASYGPGVASGYGFSNLKEGNSSAVTKKGVKNDTYIAAFYDSYVGSDISIHFYDNVNKEKTKAYSVNGLYITNSVVSYEVIKNGTEEVGQTDKFQEGDWFKVTIYNMDKSKKVDFYLADYRNKEEIVNEWKWVDLKSLGETSGLKLELSSSDVNEYGMLTPAYFCLDGITLEEK